MTQPFRSTCCEISTKFQLFSVFKSAILFSTPSTFHPNLLPAVSGLMYLFCLHFHIVHVQFPLPNIPSFCSVSILTLSKVAIRTSSFENTEDPPGCKIFLMLVGRKLITNTIIVLKDFLWKKVKAFSFWQLFRFIRMLIQNGYHYSERTGRYSHIRSLLVK